MLQTPDNSPRPRGRKVSEIALLQADPKARLSSVELLSAEEPLSKAPITIQRPNKESNNKKDSHIGFKTLAPKKRLQKALMKMNILPKNIIK